MSDNPRGVQTGAAHGTITIDAQLERAEAELRQFAQTTERNFKRIDDSTKRTEQEFRQFGAAISQVGQLFGVSFGVAGAQQLARMALAANETATAYNKQRVAALSLAGGQEKLNELMEVYDDVTGGAISKAEALSQVTRLQAVGFADSAAELERFATAALGIATATGQAQDYVISQLQLAIANQSTMRLDQLGLGVAEVKARIDELKASQAGLTTEMAYQQAILGLAEEKYGAVAEAAAKQSLGVKRLAAEWENFNLVAGQTINQPLDYLTTGLAYFLEFQTIRFKEWTKEINFYIDALNRMGASIPNYNPDGGRDPVPAWMTSSNTPLGAASASGFAQDAIDIGTKYLQDLADAEAKFGQQRLDATNQYETQRTQAIEQYELQIVRSAEDFARNRARAEADHARAIADVHAAAAEREVKQAAALARQVEDARQQSAERMTRIQEQYDATVADRRADYAEKLAQYETDRAESIADARADNVDRLADIEAKYNEQRLRSQEQFTLSVAQAAARLDGRALYQLQQQKALEERQSTRAHEAQLSVEEEQLRESLSAIEKEYQERLTKEKAALDKALTQAETAYNEQNAAEQAALDKRIAQANAAHAQQLADAQAADEQRIADMEEHFALAKEREDEDRRIQLDRQVTDHNNQLAEFTRLHNERMTQIDTQAAAENAALEEKLKTDLASVGLYIEGWNSHLKTAKENALSAFTELMDDIEERVSGINDNLPPPAGIVEGPVEDLGSLSTQDLQEDLSYANDQASLYPFGSEENLFWSRRAWEIQAELNNRPAAAGLASLPPAALDTTLPAATGSLAGGAGGSVVIAEGAVNIYGAAGQSVEALGGVIEEVLLRTIQRATGAYGS